MTENANSNETKKKSEESASERMKRAWATRRAGVKNKHAEPKKVIQIQIPPPAVQEQLNDIMIIKFLKYLDFAIENNDSGVLNTERFKSIFTQVRPLITERRLKAS